MTIKILLISILVCYILHIVLKVIKNTITEEEKLTATLTDRIPKRAFISLILFLISFINVIVQLFIFIITQIN